MKAKKYLLKYKERIMDLLPFLIAIIILLALACLAIYLLQRHSCKYGEVKDGYQYCITCTKAMLAPIKECENKTYSSEDMKQAILTNLNISLQLKKDWLKEEW